MTIFNSDDLEYEVRGDSTVYMCGHGGWTVHRRDNHRTLFAMTAGPIEAQRLEALLNGVAPITQPFVALTLEEQRRVIKIREESSYDYHVNHKENLSYLLDLVAELTRDRERH